MMTGDDNPPKMIGTKQHRVMTPNMDLSSVKKELLRQVKLSSEDIFIDEVVSAPPPVHSSASEPAMYWLVQNIGWRGQMLILTLFPFLSFAVCLQCFETVGWVSGRASGL